MVGDVILVRSNSVVGWFIRKITRSWCNHVAVEVEDGNVVEALPSGVKMSPLSKYDDIERFSFRAYRLRVDESLRTKFADAAKRSVGKRYDFKQLGSIFLHKIFKFWRPDLSTSGLAICSEVVYEAAEQAGISLPKVPKKYFSPADLVEWALLDRIK